MLPCLPLSLLFLSFPFFFRLCLQNFFLCLSLAHFSEVAYVSFFSFDFRSHLPFVFPELLFFIFFAAGNVAFLVFHFLNFSFACLLCLLSFFLAVFYLLCLSFLLWSFLPPSFLHLLFCFLVCILSHLPSLFLICLCSRKHREGFFRGALKKYIG